MKPMPIFYHRNLMVAFVTAIIAAAVTVELLICGDLESRALWHSNLKIFYP